MPSSVVFRVTAKTDRIEAALRKLPIDSEHQPVWREKMIKSLARQLALMPGTDAAAGRAANRKKDELVSLKAQADDVITSLQSLSAPSHQELSAMFPPPWLGKLQTSLRLLSTWCDHSGGKVDGRPPTSRAKQVSDMLAENYLLIVGLPAETPKNAEGRLTGPFVDIVGEVFRILDINASVESQARTARARLRKRQKQKPSH